MIIIPFLEFVNHIERICNKKIDFMEFLKYTKSKKARKDMTIQEIKELMKKNKITQIELSNKSGIPLQTLRKIFSGVVEHPRIDTMEAIIQALELNDKIEEKQNKLTSDEIELLEIYRRIPEKDRKYVFGMLRDSIKSPLTKQKKEAK